MYASYFEGGWWQATFTPMSNHFHAFLFLFFHLDMTWFDGQNHLITAFGTLFNGLIIGLLCFYLWQEQTLSFLSKLALSAFIITQLCWLIHIAQLGWGFMSFNYYLTILLYLLSVIYTQKFILEALPRYLYISIACGILCTFNFGTGILIWPSLLILNLIGKQNKSTFILYSLACCACLTFFVAMSSDKPIGNTLMFQPLNSLLFTFQLPAGPVFYGLKSWRLWDIDTVKIIASVFGFSASALGLFYITEQIIKPRRLSIFSSLAFSLILLGLGAGALITLTRSALFLDVWVDRYQIWATLFWLGLIAYSVFRFSFSWPKTELATLIKRSLVVISFTLPLIYLPSQLDLGSRLSEYKNRVNNALLSYQLFIPVKIDAEKALHWNWQHNLPFFFYTLDFLRDGNKNIFSSSTHHLMGGNIRPLMQSLTKSTLNNAALTIIKKQAILKTDLLDPREYLYTQQDNKNNFDIIDTQWPRIDSRKSSNKKVIAQRWFISVPNNIEWKTAVITDINGNVIGLGQQVNFPIFPRGHFKYIKHDYNFYGVSHASTEAADTIVLFNQQKQIVFVGELNISTLD